MSRSFGIVELKLEESDFFLTKLEETINLAPAFFEPQFYLSAFASATRSITFTIQASINDIDGFESWYSNQQAILKEDKLARYFLEARNLSQKIGYYLIGGASSYIDDNGQHITQHYFQTFNSKQLAYVPDGDVLENCRQFFRTLLLVVQDCYKTFGYQIDPHLFYSVENIKRSGMSVEDLEEHAGIPRGYTAVEGFTTEERIRLIRRGHPMPKIDWIFEKYLDTDRYGKELNE